jgi:aldose sugar dehydrogenase
MLNRPRKFIVLSCLIAGGVAISTLSAESIIESEKARFRVEVLADGLKQPWGIAELPNGDFLVTEKAGRLRVIRDGILIKEPIRGIPAVFERGQGGLLDVVIHPHYEENGWVYLSFSEPKGNGGMTKIIRGRIQDGAWVDEETIFQAPDSEYTRGGVHFGNRMDFGPDGMLYFTIGDRGSRPDPSNNAQKLDNAAGKCHRLHDDGRVPEDNPFVDKPTPSIWTYGNRNIQGLRFHPKTGQLWSTEHGPRGGDEVNILRKGLNYGWPIVTFGINYNGTPITDKTEAPGMEPPVLQWTPSIAVAGIDFYFGDLFPQWKGNLFAAALAHQKLVRMEIDDNQITHQEILLERTGRIRDVHSASDGSLLIVYDNPGQIVRLAACRT